MVLLRKTVFYLFLAIYLICCPATILYALGYSLDPRAPLHLVKTGAIYLVSAPPGAEVRLDGSGTGMTTPALLRGLKPGEHVVELKLEGYRAWSDTVPVEAERAAVFEKLLLSPELRTPEVLAEGPFDSLSVSGDGNFALLVRKGTSPQAWVYEVGKKELVSPEPAGFFALTESIAFVLTEPDSRRMLIGARRGGGLAWAGLDLSGSEARLEDWTELIGGEPAEIAWSGRDANVLFAERDDRLVRILPDKHEAEKLPWERIDRKSVV